MTGVTEGVASNQRPLLAFTTGTQGRTIGLPDRRFRFVGPAPVGGVDRMVDACRFGGGCRMSVLGDQVFGRSHSCDER